MVAAAARNGDPGAGPIPATGAGATNSGSRLPFSSAASRVLVVNPMQIVNLSEHTKSKLIKFIEAVKRFSEKWFSHVLLLMFLAVYACFGAYIFISFEAPTEQWEKQLIIDSRQRLVNDSWSDATDGKRSKAEFYDAFRLKLEDYERLLNRACASGMGTSSSLDNQWNFWGALFYSMTVFTTIGYGHLTPITFAGRVATMVYAIFGIPILLMVLADLGKLLTRIIKYTFKKFRYMYNKLMRRKESLRTRKLISDNTNQYIDVARDAFKRGYATYIQPSYNRIPQALKVGSLKRKRQQNDHEQQQQLSEEGVKQSTNDTVRQQHQKLSAESGTKKTSETTDVIVTPAKQTKPVSPGVSERPNLNLQHCGQQHHSHHSGHNHNHNAHTHHHHHHHNASNAHSLGRAHSPGIQVVSKRKISSSGNAQLKRNPPTKGSLSRSSSRSSMLGAGDKTKVKQVSASAIEPSGSKNQKEDQTGEETALPDSKLPGKIEPELDVKLTPAEVNNQEPTLSTSCNDCEQQGLESYDHNGTELGSGDEIEDCGTLRDEAADDELEDDFDIPVSFALFLLVTYMMLGAVVFSIWEGWNFFDSLYFVFISMSTIGFGDLVPQHPKRMIGTFAYLLFGLALTSMCINVVQEKIHATFLRAKMQIGEKMGFDLDQIMADDYYDGSVGDCDPDGYPEDDCCSQANSSTAGVHTHHPLASTMPGHSSHHHQGTECDPASDTLDCRSDDLGCLRLSKSRESLRGSRRRPTAGLPSHSSNTGSFRRRPSKRISRQMTPPNLSHSEVPVSPKSLNQYAQQQMKATEKARTPTIEVPAPSEAEKAPIPTLPAAKDRTPESPTASSNLQEPDKRADLNSLPSSRPRLVASRSQPMPSVSKSRSSEFAKDVHLAGTDLLQSASPQHRLSSGIGRLSAGKSGRRSEGSSRRSSVSQELNELDDLIVALSQSPSERFGPLLGIPSTGRSSSPLNLSSMNRRGTSMTTRPSGSQLQPPPSAGTLSGSPKDSNLKRELSLSSQPLNTGSSSSVKLKLDLISADSQAALEELEAIKFSAV